MSNPTYCSICRARLPADAAICKECGADLGKQGEMTQNRILICQNCGTKNVNDARFCVGCARPLIEAATNFSQEESDEQRVQRRYQATKNVSLSDKCPACQQTMIDQGHQYYCIRDNILVHKATGIRLSDLPLADRAYFDQSTRIPSIGDRLISLTGDALIISNEEGRVHTKLPLVDVTGLTADGQSLRVKASDKVYLLDRVGTGLYTKAEDWVKEIRLTQTFQPTKLPVDTAVPPHTKPSKTEGQQRPQTKFCRECGSKIPRDSKFCEECGTKLV